MGTAMANVNDLYVARVYCQLGDQIGINVLFYNTSAKAGTGATDLQIVQSIDSALFAAYKAVLAGAATYRGVIAQKILPLPASLAVSTTANSGVGSATGDPLPRQVCGVITKKTALAGKRYRGRMYIPFPAEGDNDVDGTPTGGYITRSAALAAALLTNVIPGGGGNTNTLMPVVYSKKGGFNTIITSFLGRAKWGTQRRRGSFGQTNTLPL